jgi:hypothetical protein
MIVYNRGTPLWSKGRRSNFYLHDYYYRNILWRLWWRTKAGHAETAKCPTPRCRSGVGHTGDCNPPTAGRGGDDG